MKTLAILAFLLVTAVAISQSVLTLGSGTSMGVLTGADLCANVITGPGILYGGGRICGGLIAIDPISSAEVPTTFEMNQNYPNPFNPSTLIEYQLPKSSYLSLKLYDILGREMAVLFEGIQPAGFYQLTIDGTAMASGIYFCRIEADDYAKVIKISLIK